MSEQDRGSRMTSSNIRKHWLKLTLLLMGLALIVAAVMHRSARPAWLHSGPTQADLCAAMVDKTCNLSLGCPMTDAQREPLFETFGRSVEECRAKLGVRCSASEPLCAQAEYRPEVAQKCLEAYTSSTCESRPSEDSPEPPACAALCPDTGRIAASRAPLDKRD
jgi:hypothetical protein